MRMRLLVIFCALALAGCGGGGGGGGSVSQTGSVVRQIQPGDYLVYSVSGTTRAAVTGTLTTTVQRAPIAPVAGLAVLRMDSAFQLAVDGQPFVITLTSCCGQFADGSVAYLGDASANGYRTIKTWSATPLQYTSPVSVGQSWQYDVTYTDGTSESRSSTVLALEAVNGQMAYKIQSITRGTYGEGIETEWFVPDFGYPVKLSARLQTGGAYVDIECVLRDKTLMQAGPQQDTTGPAISSISLTQPPTFAGGTVTIRAPISDAGGVASAQAQVTSPAGITKSVVLTESASGIYVGDYVCPPNFGASAATYTVVVYAVDSAGNLTTSSPCYISVPHHDVPPPPPNGK